MALRTILKYLNTVTQDPSKTGAGIRTIALRIAGTEEAKKELEDAGDDVADYIVGTASKTQRTIQNFTKTEANPLGVDVLDENGNLRNTYDILLDISKVYKDIQEEDKKFGTNRANALVEYLAGKVLPDSHSNMIISTHLTAGKSLRLLNHNIKMKYT